MILITLPCFLRPEGKHASKFTCAIYSTRKIKVFPLFVLLLLYISREVKFFIEGFFIGDYIQESI